MMFCPKCKSIMIPKVQKNKKQFVCGCGYKQAAENVTITEEAEKAPEIEVVEEKNTIDPIVDAECPKCGNMKAEYWEIQTRSADEPPTRFHRCTKCRHTWREYT